MANVSQGTRAPLPCDGLTTLIPHQSAAGQIVLSVRAPCAAPLRRPTSVGEVDQDAHKLPLCVVNGTFDDRVATPGGEDIRRYQRLLVLFLPDGAGGGECGA
jgi:hypothetical protein